MQPGTDKKNGLGLATVGIVTIKKNIIKSQDFLAGKNGDPAAANAIVQQFWSDKKTEQLREHLISGSVFLTMPSTTSTNIIPVQLAQLLSQKTRTPWANGDELFNAEHTTASKNISRDKRLFNSREFTIADKDSVGILKGYKIIIIDDIITSGGSIRGFAEYLRNQKITVSHVVGLMGDRRFEIDKKTEEKLRNLLKEKNIGIEFESISYITRTEAGGLIRSINNARSENAIRKLTENLQGIQRFGTVKSSARTPGADRYKSNQGKNTSNARLGERVQTYSSAPSTQGIEWKIKFFQGRRIVKMEKIVLPTTLGKEERQKKFKEIGRKIAAKNDLGPVQVKFTKTGKNFELQLQKERKIAFER